MSPVTNYWPTPIYHTNIGDVEFMKQLLPLVIELNIKYHPKFADVNRTDTESLQEVFARLRDEGNPIMVQLFSLLEEHSRAFYSEGFGINSIRTVIKPWGQVYYQNESLPYHNHESVLTGVLYLTVPGAEVHFHDPRGNASRNYPREFDDIGFFDTLKLLPKTGDIVIFPSYLFHSVMTNFSKYPRVVIPFDVFAHD